MACLAVSGVLAGRVCVDMGSLIPFRDCLEYHAGVDQTGDYDPDSEQDQKGPYEALSGAGASDGTANKKG